MQRIPEPELMNEAEQARAYADADFSEPHQRFIELFAETFQGFAVTDGVLDLGCGPADVTIRFARAHPACRLIGIDGAEAMLRCGRSAIAGAGLSERVTLHRVRLPQDSIPVDDYSAIISNSLLHHLHDPMALWTAINGAASVGTRIFVMDLLRPDSRGAAKELVETYAGDEPEILRRDFFNSLLAAFTLEEVRAQLREADLDFLDVRQVSDRHLVVSGIMSRQD